MAKYGHEFTTPAIASVSAIMPTTTDFDVDMMRRALELARQAEGLVEPNPMVGCVVARDGQIVGEGWHRRFGGPHAEVDALQAAGDRARGATLYVTLEPCCHHGKTPPCSSALIAAGVGRVVVAQRDPFPAVRGGGIRALEAAGIPVHVGVLEAEARQLIAPFRKLVEQGRPWVIAKWAMTLDGKIATSTGDSQWISGPESRAEVHALRGRVDAILVGIGTALRDDPLLTARPPGSRVALRVVLDSAARLPWSSQLARTVDQAPLLIVTSDSAPVDRRDALTAAGGEVLTRPDESHGERLAAVLDELGRRRLTNLLIEGGPAVLGAAFDANLVDEVYAYVAPKIVGGADARGPVAGTGVKRLADAVLTEDCRWEQFGPDLRIRTRVKR